MLLSTVGRSGAATSNMWFRAFTSYSTGPSLVQKLKYMYRSDPARYRSSNTCTGLRPILVQKLKYIYICTGQTQPGTETEVHVQVRPSLVQKIKYMYRSDPAW
jgi:hypothetical protein